MGKRMKFYLDYYGRLSQENLSGEKRAAHCQELLIQIQFFQHERLVHLLVTILFAVLTVFTMMVNLFLNEIFLLPLELLFFVLLIPYIHHYYILENGVQKLYRYYDKIRAAECPDQASQ